MHVKPFQSVIFLRNIKNSSGRRQAGKLRLRHLNRAPVGHRDSEWPSGSNRVAQQSLDCHKSTLIAPHAFATPIPKHHVNAAQNALNPAAFGCPLFQRGMKKLKRWLSSLRDSGWLVHSVRTAVAALCSLVFARLFKMPEPYWAVVTTLVVMQSTLGASWDVSKRRIIGTAIGAGAGGLVASCLGTSALVLAAVVFLLGILCAALRLDTSAYRFAGVTLAIVVFISRGNTPAFVIAFQRFAESCIGILVALALAALWPAREVSIPKT
jgi:hypothetical protein